MMRCRSWLSGLMCTLAFGGQVGAQGPASRPPDYDFYDSRDSVPWDRSSDNRDAPSKAGDNAAAFSPRTRPAYSLRGPLTAARAGDPETVAREFLGRGTPTKTVPCMDLPLAARFESKRARLTHLVFDPAYAGIPFFDSPVRVHLDAEGRIWRADPPPTVAAPSSLATVLGARAAIEAAAKRISPATQLDLTISEAAAGPPSTSMRRVTYQAPSLLSPAVASLVWFPVGGETVPAWQIYLHISPTKAYWVVADANRGDILFSRNLARQVAPQGLVFRAGDHAHPGQGGPTTQPLTGWPAPGGDCPALIYPSQFWAGPLANRCWVDGDETLGNNADVCLDVDANNVCDSRAVAVNANFDFAFNDAYSLTGNPVPDRQAALTNAFYWTNAVHDWLYALGFDEPSGNFQADNFGRGGSGGDRVWVHVQDGSVSNNAFFTTPPDGIAPRMELGLFTWNQRDSAFDGDIIVHEYVHGLTTRLIGGPNSTTGLFLWHSGAMSEGWSDAYAASFTGDPVFGEYVFANPATGMRTVAYDNSPYRFGDFGTLFLKVIPGTGRLLRIPQVHRDGELWATVLWDLRSGLGREDFEQVVTTALKLTPSRPSLLDARDAIVQAAQAQGVGGADACAVWTVFASRGFGASAALNPIQSAHPNDTGLSVFEADDLPEVCGGTPPVATDTLFFDDAESGTNGWTATGLWHRTTRRAAAGSYSWWYGQQATGSYQTGIRTFGTLSSPPINLTAAGAAILDWDQFLAGEGFGVGVTLGGGSAGAYLNADSGRLMISTDGGSSWKTISHLAHNSSGTAFDHHQVNLTRFAGQIVRLRFDFDTFDAQHNDHEGWFIDNVRISRLAGPAAVLEVSPQSLTLNAPAVGVNPGGETLTISNGGAGSLSWTGSVTQGGSWLSLSPLAGTAPSSPSVTADVLELAPGSYAGAIEFTADGAAGSPVTVPVSLTVPAVEAPVVEWTFDESGSGAGVTIADASGGGHHGTTQSFGSIPVPGVSGNARLLNGSTDSIEFSDSASLTPPSFTVRTWVRLLSYPDGLGTILSAYGGNFHGWLLSVNAGGQLLFMVSQPPADARWLVSSSTLQRERWYAVSATYDAPTRLARLYLDGALEAQTFVHGLAPETALPLTAGKASWYGGYRLNFAIDETQILPRARSASEVAADLAQFSPPPPAADPSAIAEWQFETNADDSSANQHDGTTIGGQLVAGVQGQARRFDGASAVVTVDASHRFTPARFTMRTWLRVSAYPSNFGIVLSNYGGDYQGWYVAVQSDGRVLLSVNRLPTTSRGLVSNSALSLDRWYHLAVTYDGRTQQAAIYIDGVADVQQYVGGLTPKVGGSLTFARASWYGGAYLACDIDELKMTSAAWTPAEVTADFASFGGAGSPQRVAYWPMDDAVTGPGGLLTDISGNGHHAVTAGAGTSTVAGVAGNARGFNGWSDHARLTPAANLSTAGFTLTGWLKLSAYPGGWGVIFSNYGGDYQGWFAGVTSEGRLILSVSGLPSSATWLVSHTPLDVDRWYHVAFALNETSRRGAIYVDGLLDRTAVFSTFTPQTAVEPLFGRASWYNGGYLGMSLDGVRLYPTELSSQHITADMQAVP